MDIQSHILFYETDHKEAICSYKVLGPGLTAGYGYVHHSSGFAGLEERLADS